MPNLREYAAAARWAAALLLVLVTALPAAGQVTQPAWYPPLSLYGRPVSQPYFDFPTWARYSGCRPAPLAWGYDVFPDYGACEGEAACYPSVACPGDFVAHRPSDWYANADFAPLTVDYGSDIVAARVLLPAIPAIDGNGDGDFVDNADTPRVPARFAGTALSSGYLRPEFDAGGKFTIGRRIFDCYRIEGTYLGSYQWQSSAIARSNSDNLSSVLSGFIRPADPIFDQNSEVFIAHATSMENAEVNLRYWVDMPPGPFDVSLLVGARFMQIDDSLRLHSTNATGENDVLAETENTLWGVQIGIAGDVMVHSRFWLNFDFKGGIYNNDASLVNYTLDSFDDTQDLSLPGATKNRTAFVGDISIVGHWQMTPWLVFNLGYQAMFVEGVALGLNNVASQPFVNGVGAPTSTQFDDSGRIVFHGPVIGLTGMW